MGIQNDMLFVRGSKLTWFCVQAENDLFLAWGSIHCGFVLVIIDSIFLFQGRKSLDISVSMAIDLVFVWVVEIDIISMWGMELDLISV